MCTGDLFLGIKPYGLLIAIGLLCCFGVLFTYNKKKPVDPKFTDEVFYIGVAAIFIGFLSATLFQSFYNYLANPEEGFSFGGMTFIGGLIGGVASFLIIYFIIRKRLSGRLLSIISMVPCCITIAHAFGRLGCLMAGCCHGEFHGANQQFGDIYMDGTLGEGYYVPTQLYEAIFLFILFALFSYLWLKKDFKHNMSLYLVLYGIFRFIIEFFRGDDRGTLVGNIVSPSQFWSILMVILGVALYFIFNYFWKKDKQNDKTQTNS
ncbi:MAG: prolipoprotein diacylglyceryl transferase [Clostridia bacterium]|nr:prolipoprotein diacylglyceryl transferase [Clostridia bacterium]